jgi:hypothetical protein
MTARAAQNPRFMWLSSHSRKIICGGSICVTASNSYSVSRLRDGCTIPAEKVGIALFLDNFGNPAYIGHGNTYENNLGNQNNIRIEIHHGREMGAE